MRRALATLVLVFLPALAFPQVPPAPVPCQLADSGSCRMVAVVMVITWDVPRAFTEFELGGPPRDGSVCQGRLQRGAIRYFVNGTAPSATIGTLVPPAKETPDELRDPTGTLELDGDVILLYDPGLIAGFKAIAATTEEAELTWDCQL